MRTCVRACYVGRGRVLAWRSREKQQQISRFGQNGVRIKGQNTLSITSLVSMARPIEVYWAILKQKVYENNWSAKNRDQLIRKIKSCEKKIESSTYQNLFATLKTKMRHAVVGGLESLL